MNNNERQGAETIKHAQNSNRSSNTPIQLYKKKKEHLPRKHFTNSYKLFYSQTAAWFNSSNSNCTNIKSSAFTFEKVTKPSISTNRDCRNLSYTKMSWNFSVAFNCKLYIYHSGGGKQFGKINDSNISIKLKNCYNRTGLSQHNRENTFIGKI